MCFRGRRHLRDRQTVQSTSVPHVPDTCGQKIAIKVELKPDPRKRQQEVRRDRNSNSQAYDSACSRCRFPLLKSIGRQLGVGACFYVETKTKRKVKGAKSRQDAAVTVYDRRTGKTIATKTFMEAKTPKCKAVTSSKVSTYGVPIKDIDDWIRSVM